MVKLSRSGNAMAVVTLVLGLAGCSAPDKQPEKEAELPKLRGGGGSSWVYQTRLSPNGKFLLWGSGDQVLRVWDFERGKLLHVLKGHTGTVIGVFSPDSKLVLTIAGVNDSNARLWDVESGKVLHLLPGHDGGGGYAAFSPDGTWALTGSADAIARIWDVKTGKQLHALEGHTNSLSHASFSPDGKLVLTGSQDHTARIWDAQTGKHLHTLEGHTKDIGRASFSPDGKLVLTGGYDSTGEDLGRANRQATPRP